MVARHRGPAVNRDSSSQIHHLVDVRVLDERQEYRHQRLLGKARLARRRAGGRGLANRSLAAGGQFLVGRLEVQDPQPDLLQVVVALARRAASRAACTAGSNIDIKMPMIVITTNSSTSVKPRRLLLLTDNSHLLEKNGVRHGRIPKKSDPGDGTACTPLNGPFPALC